MKYDYLISMSYRVAGGEINFGRITQESDHKLNRKDIIKIEDWFQKKHQLFSVCVMSVFELDPEPEIKNEPEEINPCML